MMTISQPVSAAASLAIRRCTSDADFRRCVELQLAVWNFDPVDVVSSNVMVVAAETGGQVLGAFDADRMIGFALAFAAARDGRPYLHSHMVAVLPEYQNHGIGRLLKLAQREEALANGIERIEWTFDPLELRNAYFNIARLGAVMRRYLPDFYGESSSPLHANLPSDRLLAEWRLNSRRVQSCLAGASEPPAGTEAIAVPRNIGALRREQPARAAEIQAQIRAGFLNLFNQGFTVVAFALTDHDGVYQLAKSHED